MGEVVHAVSNNIRIIFDIFSKLSHDPQSSISPLQDRRQRPASVNRRARLAGPGSNQDRATPTLKAITALRRNLWLVADAASAAFQWRHARPSPDAKTLMVLAGL
jgi:hypothetical protein